MQQKQQLIYWAANIFMSEFSIFTKDDINNYMQFFTQPD